MGRAIFTDEAVLALGVVVDIAELGLIKGRDLAFRQGLHPRYLEPLLQGLAREGILVGGRGRGGGYQLAREAAFIRASDVVRAVKREPKLRACGSLAIREFINELAERALTSLHDVTIASLAFRPSNARATGHHSVASLHEVATHLSPHRRRA